MEKTILVIDDEPGIFFIIREYLKENYTVASAYTMEEAYRKISHADFVVCDLIPGLDFLVLEEIKQKLPVLLFTADPNIKLFFDAQRLGIERVLKGDRFSFLAVASKINKNFGKPYIY